LFSFLAACFIIGACFSYIASVFFAAKTGGLCFHWLSHLSISSFDAESTAF
jgi:hypothetical protein